MGRHAPTVVNADRDRNRPPEQRGREGDDDGDDEGPGVSVGPLKGLQHSKLAVEARWMGREPGPVNLAECRRQQGPEDPLCLLGASGGPHCQGPQKGLNIPVIARAGMGDWGWLARLCAAQRTHGTNLNEVNGADSGTYLGEVMKCYLLAQRQLRREGWHEEAEDCRLAYRSQVALLALAAIPQARVRDRVIYADEEQRYEGRRIDYRLPGVAVAGPRFKVTDPRRPGLSTDNAAAALLARELGTVDDLGLTRGEAGSADLAIRGDAGAAREVADWCLGVLGGWWIRVRRVLTPAGAAAEMVYGCDERANGYKPSIAAAQMLADGTLIRMSPARSDVANDKWGAAQFSTKIVNGVIESQCGTGEASLRELEGENIWVVDISGSDVRFSA